VSRPRTSQTRSAQQDEKTWHVHARVVGGHYAGEFVAKTGEEAIQMAQESASVSVCHLCARSISDPELDHYVAETDNQVVREEDDEPTWEDQARAAGWQPPAPVES
jgi:hypothetical protein